MLECPPEPFFLANAEEEGEAGLGVVGEGDPGGEGDEHHAHQDAPENGRVPAVVVAEDSVTDHQVAKGHNPHGHQPVPDVDGDEGEGPGQAGQL